MKLILLLCTLLAMARAIHGFCIYNQLLEGAYILVQQEREDLSVGKLFAGRINQNEKKCCHYSEKDCSPTGEASDPVGFIVTFLAGPLDEAVASRVACTAGGALTFTNADDYSRLATCEFANGTVTDVPLISKE